MSYQENSPAVLEITPNIIEETFVQLGLETEEKRSQFVQFYKTSDKAEEVKCIWLSDSGHYRENQGE